MVSHSARLIQRVTVVLRVNASGFASCARAADAARHSSGITSVRSAPVVIISHRRAAAACTITARSDVVAVASALSMASASSRAASRLVRSSRAASAAASAVSGSVLILAAIWSRAAAKARASSYSARLSAALSARSARWCMISRSRRAAAFSSLNSFKPVSRSLARRTKAAHSSGR